MECPHNSWLWCPHNCTSRCKIMNLSHIFYTHTNKLKVACRPTQKSWAVLPSALHFLKEYRRWCRKPETKKRCPDGKLATRSNEKLRRVEGRECIMGRESVCGAQMWVWLGSHRGNQRRTEPSPLSDQGSKHLIRDAATSTARHSRNTRVTSYQVQYEFRATGTARLQELSCGGTTTPHLGLLQGEGLSVKPRETLSTEGNNCKYKASLGYICKTLSSKIREKMNRNKWNLTVRTGEWIKNGHISKNGMLPSSNKKEPPICPTMFQNVSKNKTVTLKQVYQSLLLHECTLHRAGGR